jgi:sugar fermentation stimulation protein A
MQLIGHPSNPYQLVFKDSPLLEGIFAERPNRFVAYIEIEGQLVRTQVPDPGRLKELLIPGVRVIVEDHRHSLNRKTQYALFLVESPDKKNWVSLNTHLPNRVVRYLLENRLLEQFSHYEHIKPEFCYGKSRFDFLLSNSNPEKKHLLEVKSVTLVTEPSKVALFPDAPTARGSRHIQELTQAKQEGFESSVLFVVQRPDAIGVCPNAQTDPLFYQTVKDAIASGVHFHAISYALSPEGIKIHQLDLPVALSFLSPHADIS